MALGEANLGIYRQGQAQPTDTDGGEEVAKVAESGADDKKLLSAMRVLKKLCPRGEDEEASHRAACRRWRLTQQEAPT